MGVGAADFAAATSISEKKSGGGNAWITGLDDGSFKTGPGAVAAYGVPDAGLEVACICKATGWAHSTVEGRGAVGTSAEESVYPLAFTIEGAART